MDTRAPAGVSGFRPSTAAAEMRLNLGSNENPLGPSPRAMEALRGGLDTMNRYPRAPHAALDAALATKWSVDPAQIWLGPGAVGVIDYLTRAFVEPGDAVLEPDPGFFVLGRTARLHRGRADRYPLPRESDFPFNPEVVLDRYDGHRIVYVISPHNPTGAEASLEDIERVAEETGPETLVVVDEAYGPFTNRPSAINLVRAREDVAMVRTFSKAYGLAGLRLGYAVVPTDVADTYATVQLPFGVSRPACVAGRAALDDDEHLERTVALARRGRTALRDAIDARTFPSAANFVLIEANDASAVAETLGEAGIRVRDCTGFGLDDCVRVTVGTSEQNRLVANHLNQVIS